MKSIWKYPLPISSDVILEMPSDARPLTVQVQGDKPCLWAEVSPLASKTRRRFAIFGTGHALPDASLSYIATFQMRGGALVFHAYEVLQ